MQRREVHDLPEPLSETPIPPWMFERMPLRGTTIIFTSLDGFVNTVSFIVKKMNIDFMV